MNPRLDKRAGIPLIGRSCMNNMIKVQADLCAPGHCLAGRMGRACGASGNVGWVF